MRTDLRTWLLPGLATSWLLGLLLPLGQTHASWQGWTALTALALATGLAARTHPQVEPALRPLVGVVALWWVGVLSGAAAVSSPALLPAPKAGLVRITARVLEVSYDAQAQARSVVEVIEGHSLEQGQDTLAAGLQLAISGAPLPSDARVKLLARLSPRTPFRNPSPHPPWPTRFALQGQAWIESAGAVQVLEQPWWSALLDRARARVRAALLRTLPPHAAGMARALVLGEAAAVEADDNEQVRNAGLLHALAVSGLHVALLAGSCVLLIERGLLFLPWAQRFEMRRVACALGVPLALSYAAFAGSSPSAWRAAVTAAIAWTLVALGRRPDVAATAALAMLVFGMLDPAAATRPAFLLSVVATAAIIAAPRPENESAGAWLRAAFAISIRTAVATAPIVLWCFGGLPIVSVLANVVLLPLASFVLVQLAALHALLATLTPFGSLSAPVFALVSDGFVAACGLFARLLPRVLTPPLDLAQGITLAIACVLLLWSRSLRARLWILALCVLVMSGFEWRLRYVEQPRDELRVTFLDVGQGDAALIDLPDGRAMLIDAGGNPGGGPDPGANALVPLLRARRRNRLDIVVLTHPHPDHYGGLHALFDELQIGEVWDSGQAAAEFELAQTNAEAAGLLAQAQRHGARVRTAAELCGKPRLSAGARIEVLSPCPRHDSAYDANENSIVLRVDFGQRSFLFAGDAEAHAESMLLTHATRLRADVLKVGHHGSRTSSGSAFLRAVSPRLAVISAGAANRFGHPHPEVLDRLQLMKVPTLVTADTGGIVMRTDGRALDVETWSGERLAR